MAHEIAGRNNLRTCWPVWVVCALAGLLVGMAMSAAAPFVMVAAAAESDGPRADVIDLFGKEDGFSAVLYDNTNGLPTSEANDIAETSEGFIWIGSYSGLIRYDGNTFERVDSTSGIASVVTLYADSKNRLWVGTNDSGVAVMEKGEFRIFNKADGLGSHSVRSVTEGPDGIIYVGTTDGIVIIDEAMTLHAIDDSRIAGAYVRELRTGADGLVYGVTMEGGVFTLQSGQLNSYFEPHELSASDFISVLPDPKQPGYVYFGTSSTSIIYGKLGEGLTDVQTIDVSPLTSIKSTECFGEQLVICADNGIGIMEGGNVFKLENIPLDNSIDHAMADYEGNLWFTSSRLGVMKVVPNQFSDIFERFHLSSKVVNSTCAQGEQLFIGTDDGLMVLGSEGPVSSVPIESATTARGTAIEASDLVAMLDGNRIRSILSDSGERIWLSTYGEYGLVCFDHGRVTCYTAEDGMPSNRVRCICERSDGAIMAACTGGLAIIEGNAVTKVYNEAAGLSNTEILTVCEADNGDMVLGSDGGGIYVIHGDTVTNVGTEQGLSSDVVMRVKRDSERDVFWIVTSNSIAHMNFDYQVSTVRNFPYSNNFDLYENSLGEMWILSSNGIYVVRGDDLIADGAVSPVYYGRDNGLPVIATANSYSDVTENGDLFIAGTTGVAQVNIETPFESVTDVKMAVPFVEADGMLIYADDTGNIVVPAGVSKLTVHPFVYTYSLFNPQVTYYLDGFEHETTTVRRSELSPVDYTNLGGGNYHFVMQLHDSMGRGDKELSVNIVKEEMLHETIWFRMLAVVVLAALVVAIVWLYYYRKTKKLQQKEAEDRLIIRGISKAFARTIDMKDHYTNGHSSRVAAYTAMLTRELGYDEETVERYFNIALLHDIGKIGVPSSVLNQPGRLTDEEFAIIKSHAELGYTALKDIQIMPELAVGAWAHHERPDGKGYPRGLAQDDIPRVAQIIAVADTFDAMYSDRPYRKRMNFDKAVSIISEVSGTQLASDVVDAFLRLVERGEFRDPDDMGGGSLEDIDNIHKKAEEEASASE